MIDKLDWLVSCLLEHWGRVTPVCRFTPPLNRMGYLKLRGQNQQSNNPSPPSPHEDDVDNINLFRTRDDDPGLQEAEAGFIRLLDKMTNGSKVRGGRW